MSRIGKQPIILPKEVEAKLSGRSVLIEGPKGKLSLDIPFRIKVEIKDDKISVARESEEKKIKSLHGTIRALISNMVKGVSEGFKIELEIIGVGYKAQAKGDNLILNIGFSHPVEIIVPKDLKASIAKNRLVIEGVDKQKVGELAAEIRRLYPPEPYKGKGIRYAGEEVKKKLGKALAK